MTSARNPEPDPIDDLLLRMQKALSRARGKAVKAGDLARALEVHECWLSGIRNPANKSRRTPVQLERLRERVEGLLREWSRRRAGALRGTDRLPASEIQEVLGPFVERKRGGLKLVLSRIAPHDESRWSGDPAGVANVQPFLTQNVCMPESVWVRHEIELRKALDWTRNRHQDPYVDRIFRTIIRAAHCINAMTPIVGEAEFFSPSAHRLMEMTRQVVRRVRETSKDPKILGDGYRVLGYSYHAWRAHRMAVREFNFGLNAIQKDSPGATREIRKLELARLEARLAGTGPRGLSRLDAEFRQLESTPDPNDAEIKSKLLRSRAKLLILSKEYKAAHSVARRADRLDERMLLTNHRGFESYVLRAAIMVGLKSKKDAVEAADLARKLAEEGGLKSQKAKMVRLFPYLDRPEEASIIAVQGWLPHRYMG